MTFWKFVVLFLALPSHILFAQDIAAITPAENHVFFKFNQTQPFLFLGKIDVDKAASGSGAMLYPGGTPVVFFASIMTHAAIAKGVEGSRLTKEQEVANAVLVDYQPFIDRFNTSDNIYLPQLDVRLDASEQKIFFITDKMARVTAKWQMETSPVFFLTQNQGSLILYNKVVLQEIVHQSDKDTKKKKVAKSQSTKKPNAKDQEKIVIVISDPISDQDYKKFWLSNEGINFINTLKAMYKESLTLLVSNALTAQKTQTSEQVTVRYMEDGVKKVERGFIIASSCRRTLFEGLAGEIKSVPNLEFLSCAEAS